jgi:UPF0716 protein FxsA
MRFALLLLFLALPLIELAILIKVGGIIGIWWTLAIIVGTALAGTAVLYEQGFGVMRRAHASLSRGEPPIGPMVDGMFLALAGTLLILPGFIGDTFGLLLLIPALRRLIAKSAFRFLLGAGNVEFEMRTSTRTYRKGARDSDGDGKGPVIEGEFERIEERSLDPDRARKRGGQGGPT